MIHVFVIFHFAAPVFDLRSEEYFLYYFAENNVFLLTGLSVRENVTLSDPETNGSSNSSSVAVAILVPFFALIFAGLGFYLYKQRYVLYSCVHRGSSLT